MDQDTETVAGIAARTNCRRRRLDRRRPSRGTTSSARSAAAASASSIGPDTGGLGRVVALKLLRAGALAGPDERERFLREARAVARLQHPHIVQVYDVGEHAGGPYLALELVEGGYLTRRLADGPLPPRKAAGLVA